MILVLKLKLGGISPTTLKGCPPALQGALQAKLAAILLELRKIYKTGRRLFNTSSFPLTFT